MPNDEHFRKLERMYAAAPTNEYYAPDLKVGDGIAAVTIEIQQKFFHAAHAVHGSVYFKALDDSAFFAANSLETEVFLLTTSFNIHLIRPVTEGRITAHGTLTERTGRVFFAESKLRDEKGNLIGTGAGTFMRSKLALAPDSGYA